MLQRPNNTSQYIGVALKAREGAHWRALSASLGDFAPPAPPGVEELLFICHRFVQDAYKGARWN